MQPAQTCILGVLLIFAGVALGAELAPLTENCDGCHGPQGVSADGDIPTIAGQKGDFITSNLELFQGHERPCQNSAFRHGDISRPATTMCNIASALGDEDIAALGVYYSGQVFVPAKQAFDPALAAAGEPLHADGCESCHQQGGTVAGRGSILAGQWMPYLRLAMQQTLTGELLVPPLMERELMGYSADQIDAVLNYYASQQDQAQ